MGPVALRIRLQSLSGIKNGTNKSHDGTALAFDPGEEAPINGLLGASITYRIAMGPREGQKVLTLQTLPVN